MTTVRTKFVIEEGKNKLGIESNTINAVIINNGNRVGFFIQRESDNIELKQFKDRGGNDRSIGDIKNLKIVASDERSARKIFALLNLKHKIRKSDENWNFIIEKIDYDRWLEFDETTNTLIFNTSDFDDGLDSIDISTYSLVSNYPPSLYNPNNFKNNRRELYVLEDLLSELETRYQGTAASTASINDSASKLSQLLTYPGGDAVKQDLFDLRESPGSVGWLGMTSGYPHIFRDRINKQIEYLVEFAIWSSPEIGFTTVDQILKANANGFTITQRGGWGANKVTIGQTYPETGSIDNYKSGEEHLLPGDPNVEVIKKTLREGKYRGFPIIDTTQTGPVMTASTWWAEKKLFGHECAAGRSQYQKKQIDTFRNFLSINTGQESEETDKRKCFGFEITDIHSNGRYRGFSGGSADAGKTKIVYDILMAPDLDAAIDLAFFGRPYSGMHNVDNNLLFLNEVDGKTRKEILDIYFDEGLKDPNCGRKIFFPSLTNSWQLSNYYYNDSSKNKVNEAYRVIEEWVIILADYEEGKHTNGTWDKDKIRQTKAILEGYKTKATSDGASYEYKLVDKWGSKIDEVIRALKMALGEEKKQNPDQPPPNNNDLPPEVLSKIIELLNSETDPYAKQVYQQVKKMKASDEITLQTIEKLKELLDLVKIVQEGGAADTLQKLEVFSSAVSTTQEGKVWVIAKQVRDNKGKIWVEEALALAKPQNNLWNTIGNEEIYRKIVENIKKNILAIEQATNIFTWARQVFTITGTDETIEVKDLKGKLETAQNYTEAWKAVNNHKENPDDEDGYATKAWKKIASFSQKRQETVEKSRLAEAQTTAELNQFYEEMKNNENFVGTLKESVEKKSYPRAQVIVTLREKSNANSEEKALIELIKDFVVKAEIDTDFGNDLDEKALTNLKNKQTNLIKYTTNNTKENGVFRSLPTEQQSTISLLISELTEKVNKMERAIQNEKKNSEKPNNSHSKPFLETTFGKITILIITVGAIGSIIWFLGNKVVKKSKNKK